MPYIHPCIAVIIGAELKCFQHGGILWVLKKTVTVRTGLSAHERTWSFQSLDLPVKRLLTVYSHLYMCGWSFCQFFAILSQMEFWIKLYYHTKKKKYAYIKLFSIHEYRNELSRMFNSLKHAWTSVLPSWWTITCCFFAESGSIAVIPDSSGFLIFAIPRGGGRTVTIPLWFSYYVTFVHWLKGEQLI